MTTEEMYFSQKRLPRKMKSRLVIIECAGYIFGSCFCDHYIKTKPLPHRYRGNYQWERTHRPSSNIAVIYALHSSSKLIYSSMLYYVRYKYSIHYCIHYAFTLHIIHYMCNTLTVYTVHYYIHYTIYIHCVVYTTYITIYNVNSNIHDAFTIYTILYIHYVTLLQFMHCIYHIFEITYNHDYKSKLWYNK